MSITLTGIYGNSFISRQEGSDEEAHRIENTGTRLSQENESDDADDLRVLTSNEEEIGESCSSDLAQEDDSSNNSNEDDVQKQFNGPTVSDDENDDDDENGGEE